MPGSISCNDSQNPSMVCTCRHRRRCCRAVIRSRTRRGAASAVGEDAGSAAAGTGSSAKGGPADSVSDPVAGIGRRGAARAAPAAPASSPRRTEPPSGGPAPPPCRRARRRDQMQCAATIGTRFRGLGRARMAGGSTVDVIRIRQTCPPPSSTSSSARRPLSGASAQIIVFELRQNRTSHERSGQAVRRDSRTDSLGCR